MAFVDRCLKQKEGLALPYNGFAFREDRGAEESASDVCRLYRARAFLVDLGKLFNWKYGRWSCAGLKDLSWN